MMNFKKEDLTLTETHIGSLYLIDIAYYQVSKELTQKFFSDNNLVPCDNMGKKNGDFISGEIEIIFNRNERTFTEALIAPVYENDRDLLNGDVYSIDNIAEDIISMAMTDLYHGSEEEKDE